MHTNCLLCRLFSNLMHTLSRANQSHSNVAALAAGVSRRRLPQASWEKRLPWKAKRLPWTQSLLGLEFWAHLILPPKPLERLMPFACTKPRAAHARHSCPILYGHTAHGYNPSWDKQVLLDKASLPAQCGLSRSWALNSGLAPHTT